MSSLFQKFHSYITENKLLSAKERVLVAVSGGPDSITLFHLLRELAKLMPLEIQVVHINHHLRGEESDKEATFVSELVKNYSLPLHLYDISLANQKGNLENIARKKRRQIFVDICKKNQLKVIATGHHQQDNIESIIMHLLRGCNINGLRGISPSSYLGKIKLIRPLLAIPRNEIIAYLTKNNYFFCRDSSNLDTSFLRNHIRLKLLPVLSKFDPNFENNLLWLSKQADELTHYFDAEIKAIEKEVVKEFIPFKKIVLNREKMENFSSTLQPFLLLNLWKKLGQEGGLYSKHFEAWQKLLASDSHKIKIALPKGFLVFCHKNSVIISHKSLLTKVNNYKLKINYGEHLFFPDGSQLTFNIISLSEPPQETRTENTAYFSINNSFINLKVRSPLPGDKIMPLGYNQHRKLKKIFSEAKIAYTRRKVWPVLEYNKEILWVPGICRSNLCLPKANRPLLQATFNSPNKE